MKAAAIGIICGAFLAIVSLIWGAGGFFLALIFMVVGGLLGLLADGKLNYKAAWEALAGRRSAS